MNPDLSNPEYQLMVAQDKRRREVRDAHQKALHDKAVKRRRKAKRGGKR